MLAMEFVRPSITLPVDLDNELRGIAAVVGLSYSDVIRQALRKAVRDSKTFGMFLGIPLDPERGEPF